ncbi:uncharacterized protein K460DRAFT_351567 [Cucurbitaria berberidis CBS 394.84]|uniref:F-box domain-containing protein n=1 Tax=Cucurbitaria berberidis CBS 394.84 TaxID=1168544 RepID=A0A9P4LDA8_9PLEO|nr:uncharacterized protein K460DRAFT_351567 [Cucurbitaria berberidis CBS 394.84]KAF1851661.1 hypothetical protein K460DRAFT_351567 [Cucurbitaria berberidis CBS 394.84]
MAPTTTPTPRSPLLDILPPELRLQIYEHLLVACTPLKGPTARLDKKYNLHTAILRVNKQIYTEAHSIFLGKNTFYITSVVPLHTQMTRSGGSERGARCGKEDGSGAFEPPLQLKDLPLVRHLEVDLLYCPLPASPPRTMIKRPPMSCATAAAMEKSVKVLACVGAERYVTSLSHMLRAVTGTLLTLKLCADTRRYAAATSTCFTDNKLNGLDDGLVVDSDSDSDSDSDLEPQESDADEEDDSPLSIQTLLTGFHAADTHLRFKSALANLPLETIPLHFSFPESYFDFVVDRAVLLQSSLVFLVGQVLFARSEVRLRALMEDISHDGEDGVVSEDSGDGREEKEHVQSIDLAGIIAITWSGRVVLGKEGVGARVMC